MGLPDPRQRTARQQNGPGPPTVAVTLTLLVVMAGCSSVVADLPGTAPSPYTATGAELNGTALEADHLAGLRAAGSYRSNATFVLEGDDHVAEVRRNAAVDRTSDRRRHASRFDLAGIDGDGLVVTSYTSGNATYRHVVVDAGRQAVRRFDTASEPYAAGLLAVQPVNRTEAAHGALVGAVADEVVWTQRGVERYDGAWVTRYEAAGAGNFSGASATAMAAGQADRPEPPALDVRSINATLLVSPDGVVRRFHLRVVGETADHPVELTLTVTTDGLGTTDVDEPAWVEDARERTSA